jgi:hypothetical protein
MRTVALVVVALRAFVVGLLGRTHRRGSRRAEGFHRDDSGGSADWYGVRDRDAMRALDEIRAARAHHTGLASRRSAGTPTTGTAHGAVSHALRSV